MRAAPTSPSCSKRARRPQLAAEVGAEALAQHPLGGLRNSRERGQPQLGQPRDGLRPDARHEPRRRAGEARARLLAAEHHEARGLLRVGGDLRDELVGADAHRAGDPGRLEDLRHEPAHRRARGEQAAHVEVRLVEPDDLDALDGPAHDLHDPPRDLAVGGEVGRQEHRLRAQPPRARRGHRRAHPEAARLIARGRHHRARPAPRDDHRQPAQLGPAPQLDRDVEGVAIHMGGEQLGGLDGHCQANLAPPPAGARTPRASGRASAQWAIRTAKLTGSAATKSVGVPISGAARPKPPGRPRRSTRTR